MTTKTQCAVRVFVHYRANQSLLEGMFADWVQDGNLIVSPCGTTSSAISLAESWLLMDEDAPVAVVFSWSEDPAYFRNPIENIFFRAAPRKRWHVAIANPNITTWLLLDSKFAKAANQAQVPLDSELGLAEFFEQWINEPGNQFDRDEVSKQNDEFAALNRFIEEHALSISGAAES